MSGRSLNFLLVLFGLLITASARAAPAVDPANGEVIFYARCASCHVATGDPNAENRAPSVEALAQRSRKAVRTALVSGTMWIQAGGLTENERESLIAFLVPKDTDHEKDLSNANRCSTVKPIAANIAQASWDGYGIDLANSRFQTNTTINAGNVSKLKLKWAFGIQDASSAYGQPTVFAGRVIFGTGSGMIYALDQATGCTIWTFTADATVRSPVNVQQVDGRYVAFFGDREGKVYALDADTGKRLWKTLLDDHHTAEITGSPQFYKGMLYVGMTGSEDITAADLKYPCCTFRGSISAVDAKTGKVKWKTFTIPEKPAFIKKRSNGVDMFGPGGAGVWSAPTLDPEHNAIYITTGDCHVAPAAHTCDSIIAVDLDTGKQRWVYEATMGDAFNMSCGKGSETCSEQHPDVDFGESAILRQLPSGQRVLLAGQKSGVMHAIDPDHDTKILWEATVGVGANRGQIIWGSAADNEFVYMGNGRASVGGGGRGPRGGGGAGGRGAGAGAGPAGGAAPAGATPAGAPAEPVPGLTAVRIADGTVAWRAPAIAPACTGRSGCGAGQSAAITVIPGVVFSGSRDGHMRAYAAKDGTILWDFDTLRDFDTVNGVKAAGGSFGAAGPTVAGNWFFAGSGYGALGGMPGNVVLAFELEP